MKLKFNKILKLSAVIVMSMFGVFGSSADDAFRGPWPEFSLYSSPLPFSRSPSALKLSSCSDQEEPISSQSNVAKLVQTDNQEALYNHTQQLSSSLEQKLSDGNSLLYGDTRANVWKILLDSITRLTQNNEKIQAYERAFPIGNWTNDQEKGLFFYNWGMAHYNEHNCKKAIEKLEAAAQIDGYLRESKSQAYHQIGLIHSILRRESTDAEIIQDHARKEVDAYIEAQKIYPNPLLKKEILISIDQLKNPNFLRKIRSDVELQIRLMTDPLPYDGSYREQLKKLELIAEGVWLQGLILRLRTALNKANTAE